MKLLPILLMVVSSHLSHGQACGIYRIKYVGKVSSDGYDLQEVKLPSIPFLHGYEKINSPSAFIITDGQKDDTINYEIRSHLTSDLFDDPDPYLEIYKKEHETLPIILIVMKGRKHQEITVELSWDQIEMTSVDDEEFGNLFQIDLGDIVLQERKDK